MVRLVRISARLRAGDSPPRAGTIRLPARRLVMLVTGVAAAVVPLVLSARDTGAAPVGATTSVIRQNSIAASTAASITPPAIICDITTGADSIPNEPKPPEGVSLKSSVQFGEAIVESTLTCSGVESTVHFDVTWSAGSTVFESYSADYSNVSTPVENGEYQTAGGFGTRTYTICVTASASGFSTGYACNTLSGL